MRLQRLEIHGFKSFPDRAELSFEQGVTAIVGPNGCGKSNVVDAITWVLGEQSARSLRGDRMEDVIFSGSDGRRPTGAAEVRLLLKSVATPLNGSARANGNGNGHANGHGPADGNGHPAGANGRGTEPGPANGRDLTSEEDPPPLVRDVELARRLYRSGESEYLIDGQVCRLRDVHDLLFNVGLGVKGYAVIEQGKIGQILSARPTDRRQLIEEAAGVTKYKSRRRAAELKLEAAQQNLLRVDDIIFELDQQRGTLKRQAAKARRYQRLREEQRRWEKVMFAERHRLLTEQMTTASARLKAAREREASAAAAVADLEARLSALRLELADAEGRATAAREMAHASDLTVGRLQQQVEFDRRQTEVLAEALVTIDRELAALRERRGPEAAQLEERRALRSRAEADLAEAVRVFAAAEATYTADHQAIEGIESDVEAARSEVFAAINAATALRHAVEHASAGRARLAEERAKLEIELADLGAEGRQLEARRAQAADALAEAKARIEAIEARQAESLARRTTLRAERDRLAADLRRREHEVAAQTARLSSLEELDAARAGYGDAARLILGEASTVPHLGSVADYLDVDRGYERAVEGILGDLLEHVVVAGADQAAAGLEVVRQRAAGRCGFVVVGASGAEPDRLAPGDPTDRVPGLVPLSAAVRIHGPYAGLLARVSGDAWIAPSLEQAALAAAYTTAPVATPAGDVFRGSHRVAGGAASEARGILATKREIKDLRGRLASARDELAGAQDRLAELDGAAAAIDHAIVELDAAHHEQEKVIVGHELQLGRAAEDAERLERKQSLVEAERRRAEEERLALEQRESEARASIVRLEGEQRAADERFTAAQRRLFEARESLSALSRRCAEAKAAHAALVERASAVTVEVQRLELAAVELDERVATRAADLERTERRRTDLEAAIFASERRLGEERLTLDRLQGDVRVADDRAFELQAQVHSQEAGVREARAVLDRVRTDTGELEVARATTEADRAHLAASCFDALQESLDQVVAEVARLEQEGLPRTPIADALADEDAEAAEAGAEEAPAPAAAVADDRPVEAIIADLRVKIERLGPVNMMAIEQFDELETRHTFLTTQRNDLVNAIAATNDAIKRIDRTSRERFREAYDAIQVHFQESFSTLFGGGRAGLVLLDETDLLESGIDIIAQPPGKRLQSVQLLSGGEKALTAIALMFAIFKYRPSPFCLLDEIDAPLDDANIARFVQMLRAMLHHTQFILITHNRRTMEIADRLYGVTMEEPGVSKLVSVRLN